MLTTDARQLERPLGPAATRPTATVEHIHAGDAARLRDWDAFVAGTSRGHYAALSTWLASFGVYGFGFHVLAAADASGIVGGLPLVEYRKPGMCLLACPIGPLVREGAEHATDALLRAALEHARRRRAFLLQLRFPVADGGGAAPCLLPHVELPQPEAARRGVVFRTANAPGEMLWVAFPRGETGESAEARLMAGFAPRLRTAIRAAERAGVTVERASTPEELAAGYELVERNGRERGYAVRPWADLRDTILEQVERGQGRMLVARHGGETIAVNYGLVAGRRLSYFAGGTSRTEGNVNGGALVHWAAIRWAVSAGLEGYDLGASGPPGVRDFKLKFNPEVVRLATPAYYVLSPGRFYLFDRLYPWLRRHKASVARIMRRR